MSDERAEQIRAAHPSFRGRLTRLLLWEEQEHKCAYCQQTLTLAQATLDHVIPKSKGGHGHKNLVVACHGCNNAKGDMMPKDWAPVLAARRARIARWQLRYGRRDALLETVDAADEPEPIQPNHGRKHPPRLRTVKPWTGGGCVRLTPNPAAPFAGSESK